MGLTVPVLEIIDVSECLLVFACIEWVLALKVVAELIGGEGSAADPALMFTRDLGILILCRVITWTRSSKHLFRIRTLTYQNFTPKTNFPLQKTPGLVAPVKILPVNCLNKKSFQLKNLKILKICVNKCFPKKQIYIFRNAQRMSWVQMTAEFLVFK